ncbi:Uncharacterised protein [Actinomyces bovis]|uniref:Head-to-tail adaptor n=1 Tax=Actinomyces bovis TaxID=1658 RepID=A0ABY1VQ74_9ACTO|nr:hypothetical protein [Actinomyces bovis]SPT53796.1 Uncharacterised protein [Actinomyces bovis]VEG53152.1 Uncharacterised protein [Actinomyces israelii]
MSSQLPALASSAALAAYTRGAITAADPRATSLLDAASAAVRRYCGWHVVPVITETVILDGTGAALVELPSMRVEEITALTEKCPHRGGRVHEWTPEELGDLEWSHLGTLRRRDGVWTDRYQGIRVTMRHGYQEAPELTQTVLQVAAMALSSPTGVTHEQAGGVSINYGTTGAGVAGGLTLLERDVKTLEPYTLRRP